MISMQNGDCFSIQQVREGISCLPQGFVTDMCVVLAHLFRIVADKFHNDGGRDTSLLQKGHRSMAQTVKRYSSFCASLATSLSMGFSVSLLHSQPSLYQKICKLIGKMAALALCGDDCAGPRMKRTLTGAAGPTLLQVAQQWWGKRYYQTLPGFSSDQPNLALRNVDIRPCQARDVRKPLARVEPKEHHATPLLIGHREHALDFIDGEWSAILLSILLHRIDELRWIISNECVTFGSLEDHSQELDEMIDRLGCQYFGLLVPEAQDVIARNLRQVVIGKRTKKSGEFCRRALVKGPGVCRRLRCFARQPLLKEGFDGFLLHCGTRNIPMQIRDDTAHLEERALSPSGFFKGLGQFYCLLAIRGGCGPLQPSTAFVGETGDPEFGSFSFCEARHVGTLVGTRRDVYQYSTALHT